jgi:hypothetical protein
MTGQCNFEFRNAETTEAYRGIRIQEIRVPLCVGRKASSHYVPLFTVETFSEMLISINKSEICIEIARAYYVSLSQFHLVSPSWMVRRLACLVFVPLVSQQTTGIM